MTPTPSLRRAAVYAALPFCVAVACDSLTTPEERRESVQLVLLFQNAVDTANIQTGDTLKLKARVVFTEPDTVDPKSQVWSSASSDTIEVLSDTAGRFLASRVGIDTLLVEAVVNTQAAGDQILHGALPLTVRGELFLGTFSPTTVLFRDTIVVQAPAGQRFSANTEVLFTPQATVSDLKFIPGFVRSRTDSTSLRALVPAGIATGRITLTEVAPDRRTLDSQGVLSRHATDDDQDPREPNNTEGQSSRISVPFPEDVLSIHGANDQDFFEFTVTSSQSLVITLTWNVPSNLDFELYHIPCVLVICNKETVLEARSADTSREQATTPALEPDKYWLRVYSAAFVAPTTYLLTIE